MASALDVLRAADFDWAMHLRSIWSDPPYDVPEFQSPLRGELTARLEELRGDGRPQSPLGWILVGSGGSGKTHLLSFLRRETFARRMGFVLVDMTDVHDFWETVLLGYLNSLQETYGEEKFQHQLLLEHFLELLGPQEPLADVLRKLRSARTDRLAQHIALVLRVLGRRYPQETLRYQDVIRALVALNSEDFTTASIGLTWLQGHTLEEGDRRALGFTVAPKPAPEIVEALSWLMSLVGPTVLAFDQLDPIVTQMNLAAQVPESETSLEEIVVARTIIENIARGLGALRDITRRTLTVVSCLEPTWAVLLDKVVLRTNAQRFEPPRVLRPIHQPAIAEAIVRSRMESAYRAVGFRPPYATWPFAPEAFQGVQGLSPRDILKFCYEHRKRCLSRGEVHELRRLGSDGEAASNEQTTEDVFRHLDEQFEAHRLQADPGFLLEEKAEDERMAPLLQAACRSLVLENPQPPTVDALVDADFHGGKTTRALHARLRLVHREEGDREEHFCLRALQRLHPNAFQARLKAAMTQAGIDHRLHFRRLAILRSTATPGGEVTRKLVERFQQAGGLFLKPSEEELRTLWALTRLLDERDPHLVDWLHDRRPASKLALMQAAVPRLCVPPAAKPVNPGEASPPDGHAAPPPVAPAIAPDSAGVPFDRELLLGLRQLHDAPLTMPLANLEKHTVILAGAGSGKTVLLRRLIEEAALLGTPAIVVDGANDLATLGEPWPAPPSSWTADDQAKADRYHLGTEVVVWTPGRESGRPLVLEPLPDLAAVADDEELLREAVGMARESLRPIVAPGVSSTAQNKLGLLSSALRYFAQSGGGVLADFAAMLAELSPEAGLGLRNEAKLAREMADRLRVEMETNPLLRGSGAGLDPAVLFGDAFPGPRLRVSVINLVGLPSLDMQQQFLNQLAMTLFSWIKKNPVPPGRPLRGLLAIDEAKDFVPTRGTSACKASLLRLAAQARKYHLGLLFATQHPREIDNTLIGNCSTHYYGKASSPAAIETIQEQLRLRGGSGSDIAMLPKGNFYVFNADAHMGAPLKVRIPLCLSHHRPSPLEEEEILAMAAARGKTHLQPAVVDLP